MTPESLYVQRLRRHAPSISALYFGLPVYLVGGAITQPDPRDLDVVIVIPDPLFVLCYGESEGFVAESVDIAISQWHGDLCSADPSPLWRRWARDCAKWNERLTSWCHRRVDFKTQPATYASTRADLPRVLLAPVGAS